MSELTKITILLIFLQYLKRKVRDKVNIWHADKDDSLQIGTMILMQMIKHSQSFQSSKFTMSFQHTEKKLEMKLIFCMQINIKILYELISTLWALKCPKR